MSTLDPAPPAPAPRVLADLGPLAQLRAGRLGRRLPQLYVGLVLYGVSLGLMVRSDLGLAPWDVLHSGLVGYLPITLGQAVVVMSFVVLLLWIPLREQPGLGTISNALVVGLAADGTLALLDRPDALVLRVALVLGGIALCGFASAMYIGSQLGRGPRDGLMTGLARRTGRSLRSVRTGIEVSVVVLGLLLGGVLGVGTVLYALAIGPLTQRWLPRWTVDVTPAGVVPANVPASNAGGSALGGEERGGV
ncbi:YczE/YyaS/YitT family protein [Nocardioides sp. SYSU DS0663]|uniref:membrane protein YczE n=1 Tax=Nocardioides sp. SYSU DS0663 TaxID=3416445 RepID=UPI003F4CA719